MQQEITVKIRTETYAKTLTADSIANGLRYGTFNPHKFTVEEVKQLQAEEVIELVPETPVMAAAETNAGEQ